MNLDQALAYLTPHPLTNGPVHLQPTKMREAIGLIRAALPTPAAPRSDEWDRWQKTWERLERFPCIKRIDLVWREPFFCAAWIDGIDKPLEATGKTAAEAVESVIRKIEKSRAA